MMPKPGRTRRETSGGPKNQNRCWTTAGSPPPAESKKCVPKLRSVSSMVIAPASTGSDSTSRKAVTSSDQTNSGILCSVMPGARMLKIVVMKFIAPSNELIPAKCSANNVQSMPGPGSYVAFDSGGYSVQPEPDSPISSPVTIRQKAGGSSQKLMLLRRGKAMSGEPIISGMNQLPNPPISAGMTEKKIISSPCDVTIVFHSCPEGTMVSPGKLSWARMISERMPPIRPPTTAKLR